MTLRTTKQYKAWIDGEVEDHMDLYGNTRAQAIEMVLDLLSEGEYNDQFTQAQVTTLTLMVKRLA